MVVDSNRVLIPESEGLTPVDSRPRPDRLQFLLDVQRGFQQRVRGPFDLIASSTGIDLQTLFIKENALMLGREAGEVMDCVAWKMHKSDFGRAMTEDERSHALVETVDCLHFVLNLFIWLGIEDAAEVEALFLGKNAVNHERQDSGY